MAAGAPSAQLEGGSGSRQRRPPSASDLALAVRLGACAFSSLYGQARNPDWDEFYVDYDRLDAEVSALRTSLRDYGGGDADADDGRDGRRGGVRGGRRSHVGDGRGRRRRVGRSPPRLGHRRYRSSQALPGLPSSPPDERNVAADDDDRKIRGEAWAEAARTLRDEAPARAPSVGGGGVPLAAKSTPPHLKVDRLNGPASAVADELEAAAAALSAEDGHYFGAGATGPEDAGGAAHDRGGGGRGGAFRALVSGVRSTSLDLTHWPPGAFFGGGGASSDHGGDVSASARRGGVSAGRGGGDDDTWVEPGSDQEAFVRLLDAEVERAVLFLLAETGRLAESVSGLLSASSSSAAVDESAGPPTSSALDLYRPAAARLAELYLFAATNLTAVRKVLESHDEAVRSVSVSSGRGVWGGGDPRGAAPLARWYTRTRGRGSTGPPSHLESLLALSGLEALRGSLLRGVELEAETNWRPVTAVDGDNCGPPRGDVVSAMRWSDPGLTNVDAVAERLEKAERTSARDYVVLGSVGNTLALEPAVLAESIGEYDLDLAFYASRREWLVREVADGVVGGREGTMGHKGRLVGAVIELVGSARGPTAGEGWDYYLPLSLNLFSTFLYMVNYFIAGPTSAVYIETLGGNKALAGMVIGATPWAAMISAVVFSVWTNSSFKRPLLFSGACLCVGNLLYGAAYQADSIALVMCGRVMVGLGGPRVINRRYIADICSLESRTAVSAAFVTLSAAGVAVGPGLSALLQGLDCSVFVPFVGEVEINGLTAPGYLMFLVWLIFTAALAITFHEPERTGLQQLQDRETLLYAGDVEENDADGNGFAIVPILRDVARQEAEGGICSAGDGYGHYISTTNQERDMGTGLGSAVSTFGGETQALLHNRDSAQAGAKYSTVRCDAEGEGEGEEAEKCTEEREEASAETDLPPSSSSETPKNAWCLRKFNLQLWICIILLFVDKFAQEAVMSAAPIVTGHRYGWSVEMIGALGVAIGALVVPLSICVGWLSRHFEDRVILRWLLIVALVGLVVLVDGHELLEHSATERHNQGSSLLGVGPRRYICGSLIAFSGLQCMESVIMSALSKVVPHSLASGVCNSGLINTETGTLGRAMGDVAVTLAGFVSIHEMLNTLMIPLVLVILGCIVMVQLNYRILAV